MVREVGKSARALGTLLAAVAALFSLGSCGQAGEQAATGPGYRWLDQNWTPAQRNAYHHKSQGTATLPLPATWLLALEQPNSEALFTDSAYLETFGFIPDPDAANADGLPIGFARTSGADPTEPNGRFDRFGFTCAACHTGRIEHEGTTMLIDGGPAMINLSEFRKQLADAVKQTLLNRRKFDRFADRLVGPPTSLERIGKRIELARALTRRLAEGLIQQLINKPAGQGVEEGFGRLDALNRIGNQVFGVGMEIPSNNVAYTAPVAYPHIWDAPWFDWVQYNGSIEQPMVRNAGEAMGVLAMVNYGARPTARFTSTIPVDRLHNDIEAQLAGPAQPFPNRAFSGLRSPAWPADVLGPIDTALAERGALLYRDRCQGCHLPAPNTDDYWNPRHWTDPATADAEHRAANPAGWRYLRLNRIPIAAVGTDPAQAVDMRNRHVWVRTALGLVRHDQVQGNMRRYGFGDALGQVVALVVDRWYDSHNVAAADRLMMNGFRPNGILDDLVYKARPLNGVWATGPFLHNGSVPTLWDLLSPYAVRNRHCDRPATDPMRCILLYGNRQFDPAGVGYQNGGTFRLDTSLRGNWNTGHLFDTAGPGRIGPLLSEDERRALIEYLKTL